MGWGLGCGCHDSRCGECTRVDAADAATEALEEMRSGVVIVEFWAMMSGALPFGWDARHGSVQWELAEPGGYVVAESRGRAGMADWPVLALKTEWDDRPRLGCE